MAIVLDGTNGVTTNSGTLISATTIGVGGATPSTSGAGITFPATQSASTNANTLDDYEEGTWTPIPSPQSGSLTSYASSGRYTKIGNTVYVNGTFTITNAGSSSGYVQIGGYPFVAISAQSFNGSCRESNSSGNLYTATIQSSSDGGYIFANANGAIAWTNNYKYDWNFTYQI
jgi:hypothetical protein